MSFFYSVYSVCTLLLTHGDTADGVYNTGFTLVFISFPFGGCTVFGHLETFYAIILRAQFPESYLIFHDLFDLQVLFSLL